MALMSNTDRFTYLINVDFPMLLPLDCMAVSDSEIPIFCREKNPLTFKQRAEDTFSFSEMTVSWSQRVDDLRITDTCTKCELQGRRCAFSLQRNRTFCMPHPRNGIILNRLNSIHIIHIMLSKHLLFIDDLVFFKKC